MPLPDATRADDTRTIYCHECGHAIDDLTTAKQDWRNRFFLCAACVAEIQAANTPEFDADDPRSKPMSAFGAGLFNILRTGD
jgi:hypothetical protein